MHTSSGEITTLKCFKALLIQLVIFEFTSLYIFLSRDLNLNIITYITNIFSEVYIVWFNVECRNILFYFLPSHWILPTNIDDFNSFIRSILRNWELYFIVKAIYAFSYFAINSSYVQFLIINKYSNSAK